MTKKIKVAVTGVGGGAGQSIVKSFQHTDYEVVGLDGELLGTGLYAVPTGYKIPYANSPEFISRLLEICEQEEVRLLFPGLDAELKPLSLNRDSFQKIGTTVIVSEPEVIDISDDKLLTHQKLTPHGIAVPFTMNLTEYTSTSSFDFPVIVKQKVGGARSKNVHYLPGKNDIELLLSRRGFQPENYIIQEYVEGDEYTCGSINLEGECKGVIVMRRVLRDGDTYKCFSVKNTIIEETVYKIMNVIKPFGACNVQLRMKDNVPHVFEINARCSGTTAARTLCGFNEPKMIADFLVHKKLPSFQIKELSILRYWKELLVENEKVEELKKEQTIRSSLNFEL